MNGLFSIDEAIREISKKSKVFYYGSTAYFKYKRLPIKVFRILTDMNIASLGQIIPDLVYDNDLDSDCVYSSQEGLSYVFLIKEMDSFVSGSGPDPYEYLKHMHDDNPLFNLVFSPIEGKYYSIDRHSIRNIFSTIDISKLNAEDILDIALISSEAGIQLPHPPKNKADVKINFQSLKFFIERVLTSKSPHQALIFLYEAGILETVFPFITKMKGINQDRELHPEGDVLEHTLHCFQFVKNPSLRLAFGLLLHDYGKSIPSKRKGFSEHSTLGANFVFKILSGYGYSKTFMDEVQFLVKYHMINSYFFRLSGDERKFMFDNESGIDLLKLFKADTLGSVGKLDKYQEIVSILKRDKGIKTIR